MTEYWYVWIGARVYKMYFDHRTNSIRYEGNGKFVVKVTKDSGEQNTKG